MPGTDASVQPQAVDDAAIVVLILPEFLGPPDADKLRASLTVPGANVRVLISLTKGPGQAVLRALARIGVALEILIGHEVEAPEASAYLLRMPPGSSDTDQTDFALAYADVVLVGSDDDQNALKTTAEKLDKPVISLGNPVAKLALPPKATHRLDPQARGWHSWGRGIFGRVEQLLLELFAFNWRGRKEQGIRFSCRRLWRCRRWNWSPTPYFAPDNWPRLAPDRTCLDSTSKLVDCFEELDRSALHGSYIHRDFVWIEHLGAAFAVLFAVAGAGFPEALPWGWLELVTLAFVAFLVIFARSTHLQDRWTACRLGAEQLRIARMVLPLQVLPPALATADKPPPDGSVRGHNDTKFSLLALAQAKRAVRGQGLPRPNASLTPCQAIKWLMLIIEDQINYHKNNRRLLEHEEYHLHACAGAIFILSILAVGVHLLTENDVVVLPYFWAEPQWLLLATAAGPAFAAALHGAGTRLGIVHRAALSHEAERDLANTREALRALGGNPPSTVETWREIRRLAFKGAEEMGRENTSWHGLVRRYRDDLP